MNKKDKPRQCYNCKTTLFQSADNTFYCPTCKEYFYFIKSEESKEKEPMKTLTQKQLEEGLIKKEKQSIFFKEDSQSEKNQAISHTGTQNLQANLELRDEKLSQAYATLQSARTLIYEGQELSCSYPLNWKVIAGKINWTLDDISRLIQKLDAQKKKALAPARTNQSLQGERT